MNLCIRKVRHLWRRVLVFFPSYFDGQCQSIAPTVTAPAGTVRELIYCHQASIEKQHERFLTNKPYKLSNKDYGDQHWLFNNHMGAPNINPIEIAKETLNNKIIKRPNKRVLIEQHILEDTNAAPSLQLQQHNLKKAKLADDLNVKLVNRPGPLELVEHNILQTPTSIKEALREGLIPFRRNCKTTATEQKINVDEHIDNADTNTTITTTTAAAANNNNRKSSSTNKVMNQKNNFACSNGGLIFHEYKGPNKKPELTRLEDTNNLSYRKQKDACNILLQQQKLFLELVQQLSPSYMARRFHHPVTDPTNTIKDWNNCNNCRSNNKSNKSNQGCLKNIKLSGLQDECRRRNIPIFGTKQQLLSRIVNHDHPCINVNKQRSSTSLPINYDPYIGTKSASFNDIQKACDSHADCDLQWNTEAGNEVRKPNGIHDWYSATHSTMKTQWNGSDNLNMLPESYPVYGEQRTPSKANQFFNHSGSNCLSTSSLMYGVKNDLLFASPYASTNLNGGEYNCDYQSTDTLGNSINSSSIDDCEDDYMLRLLDQL